MEFETKVCLQSVLQQATSFGEETAGAAGDPGDGALLTTLQESHGMAGAGGLVGGASKKQGVSGESCEPESTLVPRHEKDMRYYALRHHVTFRSSYSKGIGRKSY